MIRSSQWLRSVFAGIVLVGLSACSSGPVKLKPAELGPNPALLNVRNVWTAQIGPIDFPLAPAVNGAIVTLAGSQGLVAALDAASGSVLWRAALNAPLSAGVGSDGQYAAVVTRSNQLVTLKTGQELWRTPVKADVYTAPLVAGARVFVLAADRSVSAFDAQTGARLWQNQRPGEALVLRQGGVLMAVGNTLVVGLSGRLVGMNPSTGAVLWEVPVATPRGTNDIERLVDLVAGVGRQGDVICTRAFQAAVGCVDAQKGRLNWKHAAQGSVGLAGDTQQVYGVEEDGRVMAWRLGGGEQVWQADGLRYRQLTAPLVIGRSVAVGDANGWIHLLSRADGSVLTRLGTDGSGMAATPVEVAGTLVAVTRRGGVYGYRPD